MLKGGKVGAGEQRERARCGVAFEAGARVHRQPVLLPQTFRTRVIVCTCRGQECVQIIKLGLAVLTPSDLVIRPIERPRDDA